MFNQNVYLFCQSFCIPSPLFSHLPLQARTRNTNQVHSKVSFSTKMFVELIYLFYASTTDLFSCNYHTDFVLNKIFV